MAEPGGTAAHPLPRSSGYVVAGPPVTNMGLKLSEAKDPMDIEGVSELPQPNGIRTRSCDLFNDERFDPSIEAE